MNKRILLINDHIHFGGGGDAVFRFELEVLEKHGYDVYTLSFDKSNEATDVDKNFVLGVDHNNIILKISKFFSNYTIKKFVLSVLEKVDPDIIHIHLISKFPLAVYPLLKKYKVIQTLHGPNLFCATSWGSLKNTGPCELGIGVKCYVRGCVSFPNYLLYSQLSKRLLKYLHANIDLFHCPSRQLYSTVKRLGFSNSVYLPLGIDWEFQKEVIKPKNKRPVILFVGAIAEQKGIKVLFESLLIIKKQIPDVLLKIAGRGLLEDWLKANIVDSKLENNIELLGFVPHEKIREHYINADIFVMPSIWTEQFGLVGPEALACKTPCVASNIGGIPEWLHHNEWGYLVPPNQPIDLAEASIKLLENPSIKNDFGNRGRNFVLTEYAPVKYQNNIVKLVENKLNQLK